MRSIRHDSISLPHSADAVFQGAIGVAQKEKKTLILAVHNQGHRLILREKSMMSNPKFLHVRVEEQGNTSQLHIAVGTDPRTQRALLDGKANQKSLTKFLEGVRGALDGTAPAPATPVANHYLQKKTEVPWHNADEDPEIELKGNILALYGL